MKVFHPAALAAAIFAATAATAVAAEPQPATAARSYIADRAESTASYDGKPPHQLAKAPAPTRILRLRLSVFPHGVMPRQPVTEFYKR